MRTSEIKVYTHNELGEVFPEIKEVKSITLVGGIEKILNIIEKSTSGSNHDFMQFYTMHGVIHYVFRVHVIEDSGLPNLFVITPQP
jgi:hypothetical protein